MAYVHICDLYTGVDIAILSNTSMWFVLLRLMIILIVSLNCPQLWKWIVICYSVSAFSLASNFLCFYIPNYKNDLPWAKTINVFRACLGAQLTICAQKWRNFVLFSTVSLRFVLSRVCVFLYSLGPLSSFTHWTTKTNKIEKSRPI